MRYPADFNVFSFNNIDGYNQDVTFQHIEGPIAAGGNLTLKGFNLNFDDLTDHPVAGVVGGDVEFDWGGTIFGDLYHAGSYSAPQWGINYIPNNAAGPVEGVLVDFDQAYATLTYYSNSLAGLEPTSGYREEFGGIHFECSGGPLDIFEIDAADLDDPTEIWFDNYLGSVEAGPIILVNVTGTGDGEVGMNWTSIQASPVWPPTPNSSRILWNFPDVPRVTIAGTAFRGSLLAPTSEVTVLWNFFVGTLVANTVSGSSELYHHLLKVTKTFRMRLGILQGWFKSTTTTSHQM